MKLLKNRKYFLLYLLLLPIFQQVWSQNAIRVEINSSIDYDIFKLIPCNENGILVFYESGAKTEEDERKWYFMFYDTDLEQKWIKAVSLVDNLTFEDYYMDDHLVYILFQNTRKKKMDNNYSILKFDAISYEFKVIKGNIAEKTQFANFKVFNNTALIGLNKKNDEIEVEMINLSTNEKRKLDVEIDGESAIQDISYDSFNNQVNILVRNYISRNNKNMSLHIFDLKGNLLETNIITAEDNENVLNKGKLNIINSQEKIVIGTYNNEKRTGKGKNGFATSAGFYVARLMNNKLKFIKYHNFLDFKNFKSSLAGFDLSRIRKNAKNKNKKSEVESVNYQLLLHDLILRDNLYVQVAEAYYPEYSTVSYMTYDYYGRPIMQSYTVFDGYKFFNSVVAGFDMEGNLIWDNGADIWNVKSLLLEEQITAHFDENDLVVAYNSEGKIASRVYYKGEEIGDLEYSPIELNHKADKLMEDNNSRITPWYKKYFLCYGYQKIRNNSVVDLNKRTIFYMNKVAFE